MNETLMEGVRVHFIRDSAGGAIAIMRQHHPLAAFLYAGPIGVLGGLIGLGGAEFRLPVLVGPLRYPAKHAVPLNLAVSIITLIASLAIRGRSLSFEPLVPLIPAIVALISGAVFAAFFGTTLAGRLSNERLEKVILILLVGIGTALIVEGLLPQGFRSALPDDLGLWIGAGIVFGLGIGLVSSLLGVAGGELIIPTMVFAFGADIKTAGTASLLISLPTVTMGISRYARRGAYAERSSLTKTVVPMGVGSVIGAVIGGVLVGLVAQSLLKLGLGIILMVSAFRIFYHSRATAKSLAHRRE
jgi:uncharacterized membrane protein YfcA